MFTLIPLGDIFVFCRCCSNCPVRFQYLERKLLSLPNIRILFGICCAKLWFYWVNDKIIEDYHPFPSYIIFIQHYPSNKAINLDKDKLHPLLLKKICRCNFKTWDSISIMFISKGQSFFSSQQCMELQQSVRIFCTETDTLWHECLNTKLNLNWRLFLYGNSLNYDFMISIIYILEG